ncbi:unnamed protein product [Rhizophagus irregularis]|nr:unnamed protein product [Rhizophagus irregularis]
MADNSNNKSNNNNTTESIPNIALLLQLLINPAALQKAASSITQNHQQISSVPSFTPSTISNTLVGIVDTSSPRGSIQNPITKEEWNQWKKGNNQKRIGKTFLIYHMIHIGLIGLRVIFQHFPFRSETLLQKMIEDIVGNWADTERRKKIKEARTQGITPPPKRKNISPPKSKTKKLMLSTLLSDCIETEINDTEVQLPLPENPAICDVQQMLKDSDDAHVQQIPEESDEVQIQQTPEDPDEAQIQQTSENPAIRTSKAQKEPKNSENRRRSTRVVKTRPEKVENTAKNKKGKK